MNIHLNKPYKIIASKHKRYHSHYNIPCEETVVIPLRDLGTEVMCDMRWLNADGTVEVKSNAMFTKDNLVPLNAMIDEKLFDIWMKYYGNTVEAGNSAQ